MKTLSPAQQLMEVVKRNREKPAKERFQELVERGAVDKKGRVLVQGPTAEKSHRRKSD